MFSVPDTLSESSAPAPLTAQESLHLSPAGGFDISFFAG
jgi:hypothetical protein